MTDGQDLDPPATAIRSDVSSDLPENDPEHQNQARRNRWPLHTRILIGLVVGVAAGLAVNILLGGKDGRVAWVVDNITEPIGQLFLRLLLMSVIPLVFSSLAVGVAGMGDIRKLGRVGIKAFAYTAVISAVSVVIGLTLANTIKPGKRIDPATAAGLQERYGSAATKQVEKAIPTSAKESVLLQVVKTLVPANPVAAIASETPNMIHLMFFTVLFGIGLTLIGTLTIGYLEKILSINAVPEASRLMLTGAIIVAAVLTQRRYRS